MTVKYIPSVEIAYETDDGRNGTTQIKARLIDVDGKVHIPSGDYVVTDLLDAMNLLVHGPNGAPKPLFAGPGKRDMTNFND
jgi:hypothetical protein